MSRGVIVARPRSGGASVSGSYAPLSGSYVVYGSSPGIPESRTLVTGSGVILTDDSGSQTLEVSVDPSYIRSLWVWNEVPSGSIDGANRDFVLDSEPNPSNALMLFVNGVLQREGSGCDYTLSGSNIHILYGYRSGSNIMATYQR